MTRDCFPFYGVIRADLKVGPYVFRFGYNPVKGKEWEEGGHGCARMLNR